VSVSYISKVENERLHFGNYPSEQFIHKLAGELEVDEDELLLFIDRVPDALRQRIRERPEVFNAVADLDDKSMDQLMQQIARKRKRVRASRKSSSSMAGPPNRLAASRPSGKSTATKS
jgi:transcriptional regulator with XRE-family HTH domain